MLALDPMGNNLLKMSDVCTLLNVTRWTVHYYVRECEFPKSKRIKGTRGNRWDAEAVKLWCETHDRVVALGDAQ